MGFSKLEQFDFLAAFETAAGYSLSLWSRWIRCRFEQFLSHCRFVNADQHRGQIEHLISKRNNDELGIFSSLLDIMGNNGHIFNVQSGVNFVHYIQRSRLRVGCTRGKIGVFSKKMINSSILILTT